MSPPFLLSKITVGQEASKGVEKGTHYGVRVEQSHALDLLAMCPEQREAGQLLQSP